MRLYDYSIFLIIIGLAIQLLSKFFLHLVTQKTELELWTLISTISDYSVWPQCEKRSEMNNVCEMIEIQKGLISIFHRSNQNQHIHLLIYILRKLIQIHMKKLR